MSVIPAQDTMIRNSKSSLAAYWVQVWPEPYETLPRLKKQNKIYIKLINLNIVINK